MSLRYLIFCHNRYYPAGGMEDYVAESDSLEDAKEFVINFIDLSNFVYPQGHIYDQQSKQIKVKFWFDLDSEELEWEDYDGGE